MRIMYKIEKIANTKMCRIVANEIVIKDVFTALDILGQVSGVENCDQVLVEKEQIIEDFFDLSNGLAGEILQKFTMYGLKIAIIGNFSKYQSKALNDFIYECNQKGNIQFIENVSQLRY